MILLHMNYDCYFTSFKYIVETKGLKSFAECSGIEPPSLLIFLTLKKKKRLGGKQFLKVLIRYVGKRGLQQWLMSLSGKTLASVIMSLVFTTTMTMCHTFSYKTDFYNNLSLCLCLA